MMQSRLLTIYAAYSDYILRLTPLQIEEEYLKVIIHLIDGSNLRVTEEWAAGRLIRYSYYWLTHDNRLKIGWDNAPHRADLATFPHHKHEAEQARRQPSNETCLEEVIEVIIPQLPPIEPR